MNTIHREHILVQGRYIKPDHYLDSFNTKQLLWIDSSRFDLLQGISMIHCVLNELAAAAATLIL